jgi:hypothetical protein
MSENQNVFMYVAILVHFFHFWVYCVKINIHGNPDVHIHSADVQRYLNAEQI